MATEKKAYVPDAKQHFISYKKAKELVDNYQRSLPTLLKKGIPVSTFPMSELFAKDAVTALLKQKGCAGLRIYGGLNKKGQVVYVLIGVNKDAQNINGRAVRMQAPKSAPVKMMKTASPVIAMEATEADPVILEEGVRCPPWLDENGGV